MLYVTFMSTTKTHAKDELRTEDATPTVTATREERSPRDAHAPHAEPLDDATQDPYDNIACTD